MALLEGSRGNQTNMKADFWPGNLGIVYTAQEVMVAWGLKNPNS